MLCENLQWSLQDRAVNEPGEARDKLVSDLWLIKAAFLIIQPFSFFKISSK